jgi:hypothetical protein
LVGLAVNVTLVPLQILKEGPLVSPPLIDGELDMDTEGVTGELIFAVTAVLELVPQLLVAAT